jgi:hypothetical protein
VKLLEPPKPASTEAHPQLETKEPFSVVADLSGDVAINKKNKVDRDGRSRPWLKQWPKGVSGNPKGRPRKRVTEDYEKLYDKPVPEDLREALVAAGFKGKTMGEAMTFQHLRLALKTADTNAVKEITDRLEGKAEASVKISGGLELAPAIRAAHERIDKAQGE